VPLSRQFDYLPPTTGPCPAPGTRVQVPFGRRRQTGVVLSHAASSEFARDKIRHCDFSIDDSPLLGEDDLWLIGFTSDYYHHPIGEVVAAALPALIRQGRSLHPVQTFYCVTDAAAQFDIEKMAKRAPRQAELLTLLADAGGDGIDTEALSELLPVWRPAAKGLLGKGLVTHFDAQADTPHVPADAAAEAGPDLNEDQRNALTTIRARDGFAAFLLDGVTGSGKTEVYLQLMHDALARGEQILVLVPEIGLTPQLVGRLHSRLGILPALLHSGLSDVDRLRAWRECRSGDARLVVGTRSAIFTPLPNLGLIVVDEEHDHSFKQQEGLRYSARDLAITRAKKINVPVVLGSATPTLEVLQHCRNGSFEYIRLPKRAGGATPPRVSLVDLTRSPTSDGLSEALTASIRKHLEADGQVLLFLNRRGFAPTLICAGCGHVAECDRCDSRMTVHARQQQLRCHHCGARRTLDVQCASCASAVRPLGEGTERLEDALQKLFPEQNIQRIDSDSTQRKGSMVEALTLATEGGADILVGTQMLSKGHHFPKLTLVGVVNADQGLFGTDFRSGERLAQSIIQVAGRSGRETRQGEVLIQTAFPDHPFWKCLLQGGYEQIADEALAEREASRWPPFTRLALLRANAHHQEDAHAFLDSARKLIASYDVDRLRILGPVDAPMARRAGRYRAQLLLQSGNRQALHAVLREIRPALENSPLARKVRWSVDVDPIELF
jgi:primosomal protein N' (replication factor Y)